MGPLYYHTGKKFPCYPAMTIKFPGHFSVNPHNSITWPRIQTKNLSLPILQVPTRIIKLHKPMKMSNHDSTHTLFQNQRAKDLSYLMIRQVIKVTFPRPLPNSTPQQEANTSRSSSNPGGNSDEPVVYANYKT